MFRDDLEPIHRGHLDYRESFYVVLIQNRNRVHVWRMEISTPCSQLDARDHGHYENDMESPEGVEPGSAVPVIDFSGEEAAKGNAGAGDPGAKAKKAFLNIKIDKILVQTLWEGVEINAFSACTGHFVCGSSYALIGASVDTVKVWRLQKDFDEDTVEFHEWNMLKANNGGILLQASAAYSGRIACVFKLGKGDSPNKPQPLDERYTCAVTVYECESTGGRL